MEILWNQSSRAASRPVVTWPERLQSALSRGGPVEILRRGSQHLPRYIFQVQKATVFERPLDEPSLKYPASIPVVVREMTLKDLDRFRQPQSLLRERRIARFADHLETGRIGVLALADNQVAGYGWLSLKSEIERRIGAEISLQRDEGYLYDGFIFPAFRRRGVYPSVLAWRLGYLRQLGCRIAYSIVVAGNSAALKWHRQMGFKDHRQIGYVRIMGMTWHMSRPPASVQAQRF